MSPNFVVSPHTNLQHHEKLLRDAFGPAYTNGTPIQRVLEEWFKLRERIRRGNPYHTLGKHGITSERAHELREMSAEEREIALREMTPEERELVEQPVDYYYSVCAVSDCAVSNEYIGDYWKSAVDKNDELPFKAFLFLINVLTFLGQYIYYQYISPERIYKCKAR